MGTVAPHWRYGEDDVAAWSATACSGRPLEGAIQLLTPALPRAAFNTLAVAQAYYPGTLRMPALVIPGGPSTAGAAC